MHATRRQPSPLLLRDPAAVVPVVSASTGSGSAVSASSRSAGRSWGGPLLVLVAVLAVLWTVPIAVDTIMMGGALVERVALFLVVTFALGGCFPVVVAGRRRRLERH
ncbi:hypothetical protein CLV49_2104 [Labedella gwakjiensis]|uniref:Uncharacterized protein n=1 Tax=Labedella gwakjiensis TaxID=390269 RepID=A0A2P8GWZ1_9MICO|nr:hypothetical protein [Labedella gwakjiensis]PSL38479.1 hypothetical protein CLV49_2104 [Labedella gwakjiensis]RUQ87001.1 hypothetical protein ELQ93_08695 [Labedella gwakjiensis]